MSFCTSRVLLLLLLCLRPFPEARVLSLLSVCLRIATTTQKYECESMLSHRQRRRKVLKNTLLSGCLRFAKRGVVFLAGRHCQKVLRARTCGGAEQKQVVFFPFCGYWLAKSTGWLRWRFWTARARLLIISFVVWTKHVSESSDALVGYEGS